MKIAVVTILPELVEGGLCAGVVGRAATISRLSAEAGPAAAPDRAPSALDVTLVNPRDFTTDRHRSVDDTPYGGGPGMVMKAEPLLAAIGAASAALAQHAQPVHRVLLSPAGRPFDQACAKRLAERPAIVFVCARYEGLDERVVEEAIDEEISIGDYILSGGELAALVVIDAVARLLPGVLGEPASTAEESFSDALLEYPQYTRPWRLGERVVPEILASGNHAAIAAWRRSQALARTAARRPDLFARHRATAADRKLLAKLPGIDVAARTAIALVHHPVLDRTGAVVTSAVTNVDLHDLARSSRTFGVAATYFITPVAAQRDKVAHISTMWQEQEALDHRASALELVRPRSSLAEVIAELGAAVRVVATSANPASFPGVPKIRATELIAAARTDDRPILLVFGTGWGLAPELLPSIEQVLAPIDGAPAWNHLSVRSAVAILLDRLFGLREDV